MKKKIITESLFFLFLSFFIDEYVFSIFSIIKNPILDRIMEWFSHEITVFAVLLIISGLFLYQEKKENYIPLLLISFFLALLSTYLLKFLIMRQRPYGLDFIIIRIFNMILRIPDYGFPSSHSAMAFSVLPVLDKEFKKLKVFWGFFAIMVALSRIYLNQHYLSDVIAGLLIGYLCGYFTLKLGEKHNVKHL